jgi:superfamily II DNA or RNA helicase
MEITEKWLAEIGGWQAMKSARMLIAAGKVQVVEQTADLVRGTVGGDKSRFSSGLRIRSRSDVDNLCTCPMARRTGQICDHAIAMGLAILNPTVSGNSTVTAASQGPLVPKQAEAAGGTTATAPGLLSLFLPESLFKPSLGIQRAATAFLKLEPGEPENSLMAGWLVSRGAPLQSTPLSVSGTELGSLLAALVDHPRVFVGKPGGGQHRSIIVSGETMRPLARVKALPAPKQLDRYVVFELGEQPAPQLVSSGGGNIGTWLYHVGTGTIHPWKLTVEGELGQISKDLLVDRVQGKTVLRPISWLPKHLGDLEDFFQIELNGELENRYKCVMVSPRFSMVVSGSPQAVKLTVVAEFEDHSWRITSDKDPFPLIKREDPFVFYVRNKNKEALVFEELNGLGFQLNGTSGDFELRDSGTVMEFYGTGLPSLMRNYHVTQNEDWKRTTSNWLRISPTLIRTDGESVQPRGQPNDWLTMEFAYEAPNGFRITRVDALRLIRLGQKVVKGRDGKQYILDSERCEELEQSLQDVPAQLTVNGLKLPWTHQAHFLPFIARKNLAGLVDKAVDLNEWQAQLGDLGAILRPYQVEGVAWLNQRLEAGQGALLGDDMGLGKTLQSIAAVRHLLQRPNASGRHQALIVCPKSLISNWQAEFNRFAPDLKVLSVQGSDRQKTFKLVDAYDVLITSYPLITRDLAFYQTIEFAVGVFDESSFLRNPDTDIAKAARGLRLHARLALSGTPVENGIQDLWSVFEIIVPGYLGIRKSFQERFEKPLRNLGDAAAASTAVRLKRLIRPFFLRRTKREVLKELPEKIEQIFWCEMSGVQAELYRAILEEGREAVRLAQRQAGQNRARMTMLTVLLRLRQTCCDIRLPGLPEEQVTQTSTEERSGKWAALDGLLDSIIASGGKVLVFSQFVSYLRMCEEHLIDRQIGYAYLDGSTKDREGQVKAFQSDSTRSVFLMSLKAGGYGLNLTQADHVLLMDPWWNPAVEAQAIDRAHRFGQSRVVNAYRFVMRGTVEERVLRLQNRKRGLILATIEERAPMMEALSDDDLEELLGL